MELLFLSFTTLTSTGLSNVVPVKAFARSLVMIQQLAAGVTWPCWCRAWWRSRCFVRAPD